jgi:hypothetical protein
VHSDQSRRSGRQIAPDVAPTSTADANLTAVKTDDIYYLPTVAVIITSLSRSSLLPLYVETKRARSRDSE